MEVVQVSRSKAIRNVVGYLFKYEKLRTRKEKVAASLLAVGVALLLVMIFGIPPMSIGSFWGRSLQPTAKVISVPEPLAFLSFSGWFHYSKSVDPEVGRIIYFWATFKDERRRPEKQAKRITKDRGTKDQQQFWVLPDNIGVTGEGSGQGGYDWVDKSQIIGVVDQIYTPSRLLRHLLGKRFENWVEIHVAPLSVTKDLLWRWDRRAVAMIRGNTLRIYRSKKNDEGELLYQTRFSSYSHFRKAFWVEDAFVYPVDGAFNYGWWAENEPAKTVVIKPIPPRFENVVLDLASLPERKTADGEVDLRSWLLRYDGKITVLQPAGGNPQLMFDGDGVSCWGPMPADPQGRPATLMLDLGGRPPDFRGIRLQGLRSGAPCRVCLALSDDGRSWKIIADETSSTEDGEGGTPSLSMEGVGSARYYRIEMYCIPWSTSASICEVTLVK